MNEKMKNYYLYDKTFHKKDYFLLVIFQAFESLINVNVVNSFFFYFMVFFETFQIITLLSLINTDDYVLTSSDLNDLLKIVNLLDYINNNFIQYSSYIILVIFHLVFEVFSLVIFFLIGLKKYQAITNFLSYFLSFKLSLFIHNLVFYEIFITLPLFFCNESSMLTNFPDKKCFTTDHIILIIINIFLLIFKLTQIIVASLIFNDFSFYLSKLPWSSSYNYTIIGKNMMKLYLIFFTAFFNKNAVAKYLLFFIFILFIIVQRYNTPNLFKKNSKIIVLFNEGFYIMYGVIISISFFLKISDNYLLVYVLIISFAFGICYYQIFRFYEKKRLFTKEFKFLDEHSKYNTVLKLKEFIMDSDDDQDAFFNLITYFNVHNQSCKSVQCCCHQIKEILNTNNVVSKFELQQNMTIMVSKEDLIPKESNIKMGRESRLFKIKDDFLRVWGKFLKDLIEQNKGNDFLTVELANITMFFLKNPLNALFYISKIKEETEGFSYSFMIYISKVNMMKNNIINDESFSTDIQKFLEYNQHFENFTTLMNKTVQKCKTFWIEMKKIVFIPNVIERNGNKVAQKTRKLEMISNKITKLNPSDYRFFKLYGSFLNNIWRWEDDAKEYILRAYNQIIFNRSMDFDDRKSDIFENMDAGVSIVAASENKLGRVEYCNFSFASTFEYDISEIIGQNISKTMPWIIGIHHDSIILNNYVYSSMNLSRGVSTLPGYTKSSYLVPLKVLVKLLPHIENGLNYIGFVKKSVTYTKNSVRSVNSKLGFVLTDRNFRIICFDKNAEKTLFLNKNLNYTLSKEHSSNKYSLDIIFPQLSVKEKLDELRFSETTLFYNNKYVDQCYETIKVNNEIGNMNKNLVRKIEKTVQRIHESSKFGGNQEDPNKNLSFRITMTEESFFLGKIQFFIFQIVIPDFNLSKNNTNCYTEGEEEQKISEISIASIAGSIKESELKNKSQSNHNLLSHVKKTVFDLDSPRILKVLLFIFISFLGFVAIATLIETYNAITNLNEITTLFNLSYNIYLENAYLGRVFHRLNIFLLMKTQIINDFPSFNKTLQSQFYKNKILEEILQTNGIQNVINDIGLKNNNKYIVQNDLIVSYQYKNIEKYVTENLNLPIKISNIVFEVENFLKNFADLNISKDDFILNNQSNINFSKKSGPIQNFITHYLSISDSYNKGLIDYYIYFKDFLIKNIIYLLTTSSNDELFLFILGEIVCLSFIISYTTFYIFYNRTRLEILYLLTELTEEDIEKTYQEVDYFEKNIHNILVDDNLFIKNNQYILDGIKKNSENRKSVSPLPEKANEKYSDIQKRSSLETSVLIQRNNNLTVPDKKVNEKKNNTIFSFDISSGFNQIKLDKTKVPNRYNSIKNNQNSNNQLKEIDEEKVKLSNIEEQPMMNVENTTRSQSAKSDQFKLIQKYIRKSYFTFVMLFSALIYSVYFAISFLKLKEEIVFDEKIIATMNSFYSVHSNFSSLVFNNSFLLIRNQISSFTKEKVFENYNSTKYSLFLFDDFFKNYKTDYQDFFNKYEYINYFDESTNLFCDYYIDLLKNKKYIFSNYTDLNKICDDSFYYQGYEFGLLKSSDILIEIFNNYTSNPNISFPETRYQIIGNDLLNKIEYEYIDIFLPVHINVTTMYFNRTQELYSNLYFSFILKLVLIMLYVIINFIYYFSYTYHDLLKQIVFNRAIIMMIPSFAYKKKGDMFNDFLRKYQ